MDILFLRDDETRGAAAETPGTEAELMSELQDTLRQLKQTLHAALLDSRSNRKEARQWLINAIAGLEIQDAATRRQRFTQFLPGSTACRTREHQAIGQAMLQLLFEAAPAEVGALLAHDASLLRRFFKTDPKRVPLWFGHFSMEGQRRFKFGAAALAQYTLTNRAKVWHLLAWQGRHPQAPVAVAQRTHYFCELDVPLSVRHLLRECPDFWSSREMRVSVEAGAAQLLALDPGWWSKELLSWLEDRHSTCSSRLCAVLCRCLEVGPWRQHCQRLLQLLPQQDLLPVATGLLDGSSFPGSVRDRRDGQGGRQDGGQQAAAATALAQPGSWLAFRGVQWQSLDELLLAAALGCCLPLLLRLLRDDGLEVERKEVDRLVRQLLQLGRSPEQQVAAVAAHWQLRRHLRQQRSAAAEAELHELLLLHLFAAAFLVQCGGSGSRSEAEQLQQLLAASGIHCQLVVPPDQLNDSKHGKGSSRKCKKRRHGKKRRRRRYGSSSGSERGNSGCKSDGSEGLNRLELFGSEGYGSAAAADAASAGAEQHQWRLRHPHSGSGSIASLQLLDVVLGETGAAYVGWLFGAGRQQMGGN